MTMKPGFDEITDFIAVLIPAGCVFTVTLVSSIAVLLAGGVSVGMVEEAADFTGITGICKAFVCTSDCAEHPAPNKLATTINGKSFFITTIRLRIKVSR